MSFSVVPDTNVVIARALTKHPKSPNHQFFRRFKDGDFQLLYSDDTLLEYIRKLTEFGLEPDWIEQFIANIIIAANAVSKLFFKKEKFDQKK
jgi:predicted nucleic acid-binding protein